MTHEVLTARVRTWLAEVALPDQTVTRAVPMSGGFSNLNVLLETRSGTRYALRQYQRANRCAVESALAERLHGVVPVPAVVAADVDGGVLLAEFVPGEPVDRLLPTLSNSDDARLDARVGDALARIGTISFDRPGFLSSADLTPNQPTGMYDLVAFVDHCLADENTRRRLDAGQRRALDLFALADLLTRPRDNEIVDKVVRLVRQLV